MYFIARCGKFEKCSQKPFTNEWKGTNACQLSLSLRHSCTSALSGLMVAAAVVVTSLSFTAAAGALCAADQLGYPPLSTAATHTHTHTGKCYKWLPSFSQPAQPRLNYHGTEGVIKSLLWPHGIKSPHKPLRDWHLVCRKHTPGFSITLTESRKDGYNVGRGELQTCVAFVSSISGLQNNKWMIHEREHFPTAADDLKCKWSDNGLRREVVVFTQQEFRM